MTHRLTHPATAGTLVAASLLLAACSDSDVGGDGFVIDEAPRAVVTTNSSDFSSGAHALVDIEPPYQPLGNLDARESDITVTTFGEHIYGLRRFNLDTVTKYALDAPATAIWQYSTLDPDDETSANPADLVFSAPDKAYLLRYGQPDAWITDPSVGPGMEAAFKTGELDLSAYNPDNGDGSTAANPNMTAGIIIDGRLFIAMQRFDDDFNLNNAFVAVFDVATDTEINTGQHDTLPGIELPIRNPVGLEYHAATDTLFVVGPGSTFPSSDFTGGVATIDPTTYDTTLLIDDSPTTGALSAIEVIGANQGYVISSAGFGNNSLYRFDPATGAFVTGMGDQPQAVAGLSSTSLTALSADIGQRLWVGRGSDSNPGITLVDTMDDTVTEALIPLQRNPARIEFTN